MADDDKLARTAEAVKGIVQAVPVYQDVLQPAAREVGAGLQTIAKSIHVALAPLAGLIWGYERIKEYVERALLERLGALPPSQVVTPSPTVAGPVLEALRFVGHEPALREMYANLLASSIDAATATFAHPAYVEIIRQLSPDEARILVTLGKKPTIPLLSVHSKLKGALGGYDALRHFSTVAEEACCEHPELVLTYVDNICRLGLAETPPGERLTDNSVYKPLEAHPAVREIVTKVEQTADRHPVLRYELLRLTALGIAFIEACVLPATHATADEKSGA